MVLGRSVVIGVCDRGAKASWRDRGIVDRSSCLIVLSCWTDVSGSTKVSVEEWRESDMAGFARSLRLVLDGAGWLGHDVVWGLTRLLLICSRGFLR